MMSGRRILCVVALVVASGCAQLAPRAELPIEQALPPAATTYLDQLMAPREAARPGQSAFRLLHDGPEAFALRAISAQQAGRSLDVQTYIWHDDLTGSYLAWLILEAADRGVRVRLLVDDMDARAKNYGFAALAAHPNIHVRMFNPFSTRRGALALVFEALGSFSRINRRMHNKTWIVDNRLAIAGGRNLGDEYFGAAADGNFVDLDFAMVGPVVRDASASFDAYWNSPLAYPMTELAPADISPERLDLLRSRLAEGLDAARDSRYARELGDDDVVRRLVAGDWPMTWTADYRFVADDPRKAEGAFEGAEGSAVIAALLPAMRGSREALTVISPYFVPGDGGTALLVGIDQAGSDVRVLTNSLAANDVAAVHGGYARHREALLVGGVELWELKPVSEEGTRLSLVGSSGASLHTKAMVLNRRGLFVGSYNLDPRSTSLNCEQGVLVESEVLALELEALFAEQVAGARAWAVALEDGELRWRDGMREESRDPDASFGRRFQAWLARILRIDAQL
ncbi:MAG: phospholipase D family protein [Gammaproteobacteria bacterium]|jgi:putative cardiolipin synthase